MQIINFYPKNRRASRACSVANVKYDVTGSAINLRSNKKPVISLFFGFFSFLVFKTTI